MKHYKIFIAFIILISCEANLIAQSPLEELAKKKELWKEKGVESYSFTQTISCFCMREYTLPHRVAIQNKQIATVDGKPLDNDQHQGYFSVEERFDYIEAKLKKNPAKSKIEYDPVYGFPSYFYFDMDYQIADEEIGYTFTYFSPIKR